MRHLYTVKSVIEIPGLGITGPITRPTNLDPEIALAIVNRGGVVFEHNPMNTKEKTKVTKFNYKNIHFVTTRSDMLKEKTYNGPHKNIVPTVEENRNDTKNEYFNKHDKHNKNKFNNSNKQNKEVNKTEDLEDNSLTKPDGFEKN